MTCEVGGLFSQAYRQIQGKGGFRRSRQGGKHFIGYIAPAEKLGRVPAILGYQFPINTSNPFQQAEIAS